MAMAGVILWRPSWGSARLTCSIMRPAWEDCGCRVHEIVAPGAAAERGCTAGRLTPPEFPAYCSGKWQAVLRMDLQTAFLLFIALAAMAVLAARLAPPARSDDHAPVASDSAGQGACL